MYVCVCGGGGGGREHTQIHIGLICTFGNLISEGAHAPHPASYASDIYIYIRGGGKAFFCQSATVSQTYF